MIQPVKMQNQRSLQARIAQFRRQASPYTKPGLRDRIKARIQAGSKGGKPGQWSAIKSNLLASAYRKEGGGYHKGRSNRAQHNLRRWNKEKWRTSDRKPAIRAGGTRRFLPDKAWKRLSPGQIGATNRVKVRASRQGRQFVRNTPAARHAGRTVRRRTKL